MQDFSCRYVGGQFDFITFFFFIGLLSGFSSFFL